jgi:hypothetical protein
MNFFIETQKKRPSNCSENHPQVQTHDLLCLAAKAFLASM